MGSTWFVYIAELANGWLYVGVTKNLERRALEHELGNSIRTTRIFGFKRLLYSEPHAIAKSRSGNGRAPRNWPSFAGTSQNFIVLRSADSLNYARPLLST